MQKTKKRWNLFIVLSYVKIKENEMEMDTENFNYTFSIVRIVIKETDNTKNLPISI